MINLVPAGSGCFENGENREETFLIFVSVLTKLAGSTQIMFFEGVMLSVQIVQLMCIIGIINYCSEIIK